MYYLFILETVAKSASSLTSLSGLWSSSGQTTTARMFLGYGWWDHCSLPSLLLTPPPLRTLRLPLSLLSSRWVLHPPDLLSSWCEEEVSHAFCLSSFIHPYWKRKAFSPPFFIQDILTAIVQFHIHAFVSCSLVCFSSHTCRLPARPIPFPTREDSQHFPFPVLHPSSRHLLISVTPPQGPASYHLPQHQLPTSSSSVPSQCLCFTMSALLLPFSPQNSLHTSCNIWNQ